MNNLGTLYYYELKKLLKRKIVWITLLLCLTATAVTMVAGLLGSYYIDNKKVDTNYNMFLIDREYQKVLEGKEINQSLLEEMSNAYHMIPLTAERYNLTEEYQKYARPYSEIFNFVRNATNMTASEAMQWIPNQKDLYAKRQVVLENDWKNANLSDVEKEFWRQKEAELKTPFVYQITESYFMLFRAVTTIGLLVLLSVSVCLAGTFAEEHIRRTDQLILCSTHGKGMAYWVKVLMGISFAIGISLIISTFAFMLAFAAYGTESFHAILQLIFAEYSYPLTVGQAVLILYGCLLVTAVIFSVIVMLLSEMFRSSIATLAVTSGMLILSMVCSVPPQSRILSQIWDYLPSGFLTPWNIFDIRLLSVFGHHFTAWQAVPIIYLLVSIVIVMFEKMIYQRYQVSGR